MAEDEPEGGNRPTAAQVQCGMAGLLDSVTHKTTILTVSVLAGAVAFGWTLATTKLTPEVVSEMSKADPTLRERMETLRRDVRESVAKGDVARAARLQEELVRLDPASVRARLKLVELLEEAGRTQEAQTELESTAEMQLGRAQRAGDSVVDWEQAASVLAAAGREADAHEAKERAAELHLRIAERDRRGDSWERAAALLHEMGDDARAKRAWFGAARQYERVGRNQQGRNPQVRRRLAALDSAYTYYMRAGTPQEAERVARATIDAFQELAETNDNAVWTPLYVGWAHKRLGRDEEARRIWQLGRQRADRMLDEGFTGFGWYNTACLRALAGDEDAAIQALERASRVPQVSTRHVLNDRDLESLRDHPRFREIAERFRGGGLRGQ